MTVDKWQVLNWDNAQETQHVSPNAEQWTLW
jgi:hypothetical protein